MKEELPLVSIVTPSYNKGAFIEETILSVKNQTYPRVEHIVIDGGSTDNTLDLIKKYEGTYNMLWVSEPDEGQSDAINKGWRKARGKILAYLNADDTYMPWAIETAVKFLTDHPDVSMVYGDCNIVNECNEVMSRHRAKEFDLKDVMCGLTPTPTLIFRREILDKVGYLDTNLYIGWDYDFWLRVGLKFKVQHIPHLLVNFRRYSGTKCGSEGYKFGLEHLYIIDKTFSNPELPEEVKTLRRQAYSCAHLGVGLSYHFQRQMKPARKHLIKSIMLYPPNLLRPWVAGYLVTSLLGRRVTDIVVRWKSKLSGR